MKRKIKGVTKTKEEKDINDNEEEDRRRKIKFIASIKGTDNRKIVEFININKKEETNTKGKLGTSIIKFKDIDKISGIPHEISLSYNKDHGKN